jgi:aminoglycoside 6'-N-acetyltransferase I
MQIIDLDGDNGEAIQQCAALLVEGFRQHWPSAWPDLPSALDEVRECLEPSKFCRMAVDERGSVLGWVGARSEYAKVWELHPLVVRPDRQRQGIGRALVLDLEEQVRERGGITLYLGTDDEADQTTLAGVDLYPNPLEHLSRIRNLRGHPYEFYQKVGFVIVGVIPDANGLGKPDILMAKRVGAAGGSGRDGL